MRTLPVSIMGSRRRKLIPPFDPVRYGTVHAHFKAGTSVMYQEISSPSTAVSDGDPVGTVINDEPASPNPISNWVAPSNAARPVYRADAYSSGYPALEFDGTDDVLQWANSQLSVSEISAGATLYVVFNPVTKTDTYGIVSLNGVPNDNQHQSVWIYTAGHLGYFNRDEDEGGGAGTGNGVNWVADGYDYITNAGPHVLGVALKGNTDSPPMMVTEGITDKGGAYDAEVDNITDLEVHSSMYIGGDAWAAGASKHFGQGFVHEVILFEGQQSSTTIQTVIDQYVGDYS